MKELLPLFQTIGAGIFGLLVAVVTWALSLKREKTKLKEDYRSRRLKELEELYASVVALFDKIIRAIKTGEDYSFFQDDFSIFIARVELSGSELVNKKLDVVSDYLWQWSSMHLKGLGTKMRNTSFHLVSNTDFKFQDEAKNIYPDLIKAIRELVDEMKAELNQKHDALYK